MDYELTEELRSLSKYVPEQMCDGEGKDPLERAADTIETLLAERDALIEELRGICWCCAHGREWENGPGLIKMITCERLKEIEFLTRCPHWQWRGPKKDGAGQGGMQSAGVHPSIYCPVCGKPAVRYEPGWGWMHFTKKGSVWHKEKPG